MDKKVKLSLLENGTHSLVKGLDIYQDYTKLKEQTKINEKIEIELTYKIKEVILFLSHGIELLLKQLLKESNSELLMYSKIDSYASKIINRNPISNEKTAGFEEILLRVFSSVIELDEPNRNLYHNIMKLKDYRNEIQHFEIDQNFDIVDRVIGSLSKDDLGVYQFFKKYLKGFDEKDTVKEKIENIDTIYDSYHSFFSSLIEKLSADPYNFVKRTISISKRNFFTIKSTGAFYFVATFSRKGLRAELYIDSKNKNLNQWIFDTLSKNKNQYQSKFYPEKLEFEELSEKTASRIVIYKKSNIKDMTEKNRIDSINWLCDQLVKMNDVFSADIKMINEQISKFRFESQLSQQDED